MKPQNLLPIQLFAACLVGLLLGKFCFSTTKEKVELSLFNGRLSKMQAIINIIDNKYVDVINIDSLNELVIPDVLSRLDPHSAYIPSQKLNEAEKKLVGHFYGIGIENTVFDDTATVICVLQGGPARHADIMPGDKIIEIDGINVTGPKAMDLVTSHIKGECDTPVKVGLKRHGADSLIITEIIRGSIPVPSASASYMTDSTTGYIKMESFGDYSHKEFVQRVQRLRNDGARNIIIDLRDNLGGRVEQAKRIASEILDYGDTIAFTIGRHHRIEDLFIDTTQSGACSGMNVACLVDSHTASAAEILSAAIQDNDRGVIIGRRTFGKGLVQTPIQMPDGSQVRLTTLRYYTPSGRSLQKDYKDYENDLNNRYRNGELDSSSAFRAKDTTKYYTKHHRTVYSKSGVMPDIFIPIDRTQNTILDKIDSRLLTLQFAADKYNQYQYNNPQQFIQELFSNEKSTFDELITFAQHHGIAIDHRKDRKELANIYNELIAWVKYDAYHIAGDNDMSTMYYNYNDPAINTATEILNDNKQLNNILNINTKNE